jgi:hypothetical protein
MTIGINVCEGRRTGVRIQKTGMEKPESRIKKNPGIRRLGVSFIALGFDLIDI